MGNPTTIGRNAPDKEDYDKSHAYNKPRNIGLSTSYALVVPRYSRRMKFEPSDWPVIDFNNHSLTGGPIRVGLQRILGLAKSRRRRYSHAVFG